MLLEVNIRKKQSIKVWIWKKYDKIIVIIVSQLKTRFKHHQRDILTDFDSFILISSHFLCCETSKTHKMMIKIVKMKKKKKTKNPRYTTNVKLTLAKIKSVQF